MDIRIDIDVQKPIIVGRRMDTIGKIYSIWFKEFGSYELMHYRIRSCVSKYNDSKGTDIKYLDVNCINYYGTKPDKLEYNELYSLEVAKAVSKAEQSTSGESEVKTIDIYKDRKNKIREKLFPNIKKPTS